MLNILSNEVYKILARKKIYIFMLIILIMSIFIAFATHVTNNTFGVQLSQEGTNQLQSELASQLGFSGQAFPVTLLDSLMSFILPIFVVIIVTDIVTGEYAEGSLKLPLMRQITRGQLLWAKIIALAVSLLLLIMFTLILGYSIGFFLFGFNGNFLLKGLSLQPIQGFGFTVMIYMLSILPLLAFGMMILFFSVAINNEGVAVSVGIGVFVILSVLSQLSYKISPYLINTYFGLYNLFSAGLDIGLVIAVFAVSIIYGGIFYLLSLSVFKKKDILT